MTKAMNNLTKTQKIIIVTTILWELFLFILIQCSGKFHIAAFLICSFPAILYWCGVWIWGFGYIINTFRHLNKFIFGQNPLKFFFSYEGTFNRSQYFGGICLINLMFLGIEQLNYELVTFIAAVGYLFSLFAFVQKRCRDMDKTGTLIVSFITLGVISKAFVDGMGLKDDNPITSILYLFILLMAGTNLYLIFGKGIEKPELNKKSILLKKPILFVLSVFLFFWGIIISTQYLFPSKYSDEDIGKAIGAFYRHTVGYKSVCSNYGYQMISYPLGFTNKLEKEIEIINQAAQENGYSFDELMNSIESSKIGDQTKKSIRNELYALKNEWSQEQNISMYEVCQTIDSDELIVPENDGYMLIKNIAEKIKNIDREKYLK